jgi:hypothetical protein
MTSWNSLLKQSSNYLMSDDFKKRVIEEDETMLKMISPLSKINLMGYLTTQSQQGNIDKFYKQKQLHIAKERAFVTGLMEKSLAKKFIQNLNIMTDKCAIAIPILPDKCVVNLPADLDIPLTITTKIKKKQTIVETHMSTAIPKSVVLLELKQIFPQVNFTEFLKKGKFVYIFCWDVVWGRLANKNNGLFQSILHVLKKHKN